MLTRFALLLITTQLFGAVTRISTATGEGVIGAGLVQTSTTLNVATHDGVLCHVSSTNTPFAYAVTDGAGNTFVPLSAHTDGSLNIFSQFWYVSDAAANASMTVSVIWTLSMASTDIGAVNCVQLRGQRIGVMPDLDDPSNTGMAQSNSTDTNTVSTLIANSVIFVAQACSLACTPALTTPVGYFNSANSSTGLSSVYYKTISGLLTNDTTHWTFTGNPWHAPAIVSIRPDVSATFYGPIVNSVNNSTQTSIAFQTSTVSTASTVDLTTHQGIIHLSGAGTIDTMLPDPYFVGTGAGGCVFLIPGNAISFSSRGNMYASFNVVANQLILACYDSADNKWRLLHN